MLVGSFAHPEIGVHLRGSLELRRGSQPPSWRALDNFSSGIVAIISLPSHRIPSTSGVPVGRPQPLPALLKDFLFGLGRASSHPYLTPSYCCQLASDAALLCPLFLSSPPTVGGGGWAWAPRSGAQGSPSLPWASKAQRD